MKEKCEVSEVSEVPEEKNHLGDSCLRDGRSLHKVRAGHVWRLPCTKNVRDFVRPPRHKAPKANNLTRIDEWTNEANAEPVIVDR